MWLLWAKAGVSTLSIDTCGSYMTRVWSSLTLIHVKTRGNLWHRVVVSMITMSTGTVEPAYPVNTNTVTTTLVNILSKLTFIDVLLTVGPMVAWHTRTHVWRYASASIITWWVTDSWNRYFLTFLTEMIISWSYVGNDVHHPQIEINIDRCMCQDLLRYT